MERLMKGLGIVCSETRDSKFDFDITLYRDQLCFEIHNVMFLLGTKPNEEQSFQNLYWKLREMYPEKGTSVVHFLTPFIRCPDTIEFLYELSE